MAPLRRIFFNPVLHQLAGSADLSDFEAPWCLRCARYSYAMCHTCHLGLRDLLSSLEQGASHPSRPTWPGSWRSF